MREKEYCVRVVLNPCLVLYVGVSDGLYNVFIKSGEIVYKVCGGYKNLGTACNRLLKKANSYNINDGSYYYMGKTLFLKKGGVF